MIKAGICAARSDEAAALIKILVFHPDINLVWVYDGEPEERLDNLYRWLTGDTDLLTIDSMPDSFDDIDVLLVVDELNVGLDIKSLPDSLKVIDLTGRYRLDDDITYGLAEINRKLMVHDCYKVAVPDALAQAVELAILPMARNLMIGSDIEVKFEADDVPGLPQVEQEIKRLVKGVQASFNSDVNIEQVTKTSSAAILLTVTLSCGTDIEVLNELYRNYFDDHNFTFIIDRKPKASDVIGTNKCLMHLERIDNKLIVTAAIDRRLKGVAGTAVHVLNLLFGLHERVGLETF